MTKGEAIKEHRAMWLWIAQMAGIRHRYIDKYEYFSKERRKMFFEKYGFEVPASECFCCQYAKESSGDETPICYSCPILWKDDEWESEDRMKCSGSFYLRWCASFNLSDCVEYAMKIALLPVNEEV